MDRGPQKLAGEIAPEDPLWEGAQVDLAGPIRVEAVADGSASRTVWVRGSLAGRVRAACRRCLRPIELEVGESFGLLFDPQLEESEGDLTLYALDPRADELDLRAAVRERWLLAVPKFPLCSEDCRGLCPACGVNRNEESCDCKAEELDPRWGPLSTLRSDS